MFDVKDRRDLIEKLEENRQALLEVVATLDEKQAETPQKAGDRSPKGQLLHLAEAEHHYVWEWARRSRDEDSPDLSGSDPGATGEAPLFDHANEIPLAQLLERLEHERRLTYRFVAETADSEMERAGRNTPFGELSVHQFLKSLYRHDRMHQDEVLGRESTYVVTTQEGHGGCRQRELKNTPRGKGPVIAAQRPGSGAYMPYVDGHPGRARLSF